MKPPTRNIEFRNEIIDQLPVIRSSSTGGVLLSTLTVTSGRFTTSTALPKTGSETHHGINGNLQSLPSLDTNNHC